MSAADPMLVDLARLSPMERAALGARLSREAMRDKSYQELPLGEDVAAYLRAKRKRLTDSSYRDYEGVLDKLARHFPDLRVEDFEPPTGAFRLEEFLDATWGAREARTYNKALSIVSDFCRHWQRHGRLMGSPTLLIERAKTRGVYRTTFTADQRRAIIAEQPALRDRIALRLLLDYALRKSALSGVQFQHFDHQRRVLTIFTKGERVRELPLPDRHLWLELERLILDVAAAPEHYLLCSSKPIPVGRPDGKGRRRSERRLFPAKPMSSAALHRWWYGCLQAAGVVPEGVTRGERMHKARHTAGQRLLDGTQGNLKAVQKLLGHASIQTTADIYVDWDNYQLATAMQDMFAREDEDD